MIRVLFTVALFIVVSALHAQDHWYSLQGVVVDAETRQPLPFASIRLRNKNLGTLSNADGNFLFKIPAANGNDSIEFSFVGYKPEFVLASQLQDFKMIELIPAVRMLDAITVKARSALDIVKEFIQRIPENYDTIGSTLQAFYREEINLDKDSLVFNEAVVNVKKTSYTKPAEKDEMNILKGRRANCNWKGDPMYAWLSGLSNGARSSMLEDVVKFKAAPNVPFNPSNFRYYNFILENTIDQGTKTLYQISFAPVEKVSRSKFTLSGTLFINASSFALERLEFSLATGGLRYVNNHRGLGYRIGTVAYKASVVFTDMKEVITWSETNGKMMIKQVQRNFTAEVTSLKRNMIKSKWRANSLFVITDAVSGKTTTIAESENIMNKSSSIGTLMWGKENDKEFWENYNIVQPSYVDTLSRISTPIETLKTTSKISNRQNGFTRADSLHGSLSSLRSCYDVTFYHLDISVEPQTKFIKGSSTIRFKVVNSFSKMQIDLYENMKIEKIRWHEKDLLFTREFGAVYIAFETMLLAGSDDQIIVFYSGTPQVPDFRIPMNGGFLWDKDANGKPWVQVVCQGSGSSLWWPSKDHLSDESDSARITVTVPHGLIDISNGRLRSKTELPGNLTRFDWYVSYPINNYNITLNIGDYHHVHDTYAGIGGPLTLDYYYIAGSEKKTQQIFSKVKPMLRFYESKFGEYPFPRDGFTLMESLYPMEHQSAVSIGKLPSEKIDSLMLESTLRLMHHEVAHEWWGNNVSIGDYADFWIHEGFASYAEALMLEAKYGYDASTEYLLIPSIKNEEPIIGVHGVNHIFYDLDDVYNKSALMLNTLRHVINNDALWFSIIRAIQTDFKFKIVSSGELEQYISRKAKMDLSYFFDQYLRQPKPPKFAYSVTQQSNNVILKYKWETDVKDFRMPIKVTTGRNAWGMIQPTTEWQTKVLTDFRAEEFEVKEQDFYVELGLATEER